MMSPAGGVPLYGLPTLLTVPAVMGGYESSGDDDRLRMLRVVPTIASLSATEFWIRQRA